MHVKALVLSTMLVNKNIQIYILIDTEEKPLLCKTRMYNYEVGLLN